MLWAATRWKIIMGGNFTTLMDKLKIHLILFKFGWHKKDPSFEIGTGIPPSNHQHHVRD